MNRSQQIISTEMVTVHWVVVVVLVIIPDIIPKDILATSIRISTGTGVWITIETPILTWESKRAIKTWITVHKRMLCIIFNGRSLQFCIGIVCAGAFSILHREEIHNHISWRLAIVSKCIGWTNLLFPEIVTLIIRSEVRSVFVITGHKHGLGIIHNTQEHFSPTRTVHTWVILIGKTIATGIDRWQFSLNGVIRICPTGLIIVAIEERTCPKHHNTVFECKACTGSDTSPIVSRPRIFNRAFFQHFC